MTKEIAGAKKPELPELPQVKNRMSFLYLEKCEISRQDSAILVRQVTGTVRIPAAMISVLLLGPGTTITHRGMELIGDAGVSIAWVGEKGVRYYAGGRPLTHRSTLLQRQAEYVSNQQKHLAVARKMYELRFPNEDVSKMSMHQLRGKEGARIRRLYKELAEKYNIPWEKRSYNPEDFEESDAVNQALTAGNQCLYGLAHAVIHAMGLSCGLGFVHVGHEESFSYDIADLYKAETSIPLAFELASMKVNDIASETRRRMRDLMFTKHILQTMVKDIKYLLDVKDEDEDVPAEEAVYLWDGVHDLLPSGKMYN